MLNTLIKNKGMTKTIVNNNVNSLNWDLDYDGNIANISLDSDLNGKNKHYDISLDNNDLAYILNINSVNKPLDQRLLYDFNESKSVIDPYLIELPTAKLEPIKYSKKNMGGITSPLSYEEFIVPITIDKSKLTPKKRHRRHKSHLTHRAYKKTKSNKKSRSKRNSLIDLL